MRSRYYLKLFLLALLVFFVSRQAVSQESEEFEISKNLDIFTTLYKQIYLNYVDNVNHGELFKTGIDAMLETIDPYTVYIPEAEIEDYRTIWRYWRFNP